MGLVNKVHSWTSMQTLDGLRHSHRLILHRCPNPILHPRVQDQLLGQSRERR